MKFLTSAAGTIAREYKVVPSTGAGSFQWLPDNRRMLFGRGGGIVAVDWLSGQSTPAFSIPGEGVSIPRRDRGGSYLYFTHGTAMGDIGSVRLSNPSDSGTK